jgi:hypothetical protein
MGCYSDILGSIMRISNHLRQKYLSSQYKIILKHFEDLDNLIEKNKKTCPPWLEEWFDNTLEEMEADVEKFVSEIIESQ